MVNAEPGKRPVPPLLVVFGGWPNSPWPVKVVFGPKSEVPGWVLVLVPKIPPVDGC